ncbi:ribonuclease H-like domain-containing protein, partial [Phakopsora pachyrhizi]
VYCDGACSGNGRKGVQTPAGSGVWWQDTAKRLPGPAQSNNRAELYAIWLALQSDPDPNSKMEILTDSQYSINCFGKWLPKWLSNNYKKSSGEPVENQDLIEAIRLKLEFRDRLNPRGVVFTYVKGHSGDYGNTQADKLARIG